MMATFEYEALTAAGRLMTGTVEAASHDEASEMLKGMQLVVRSITKAAPPKPRTAIGRSEFLLFNQQLAAIARAGIPLERSLRELATDAASPRMRRLIETIAAELESGTPLPEAFEKHHRHFPPLYGRIIEAGVRSGRLGEMLTSLNRHSETAAQTRRILFEATCYPAVVLALAAVIFTGILVFVVPPLGRIFDEMGRDLPEATASLMTLARNVDRIWMGISAVIAALLLSGFILGRFPGGRRVKETVAFSLPLLGRLYRDTVLSRLADAMAALVSAGCDMPSCLRLAAGSTGCESVVAECEALARHVEQGQPLLAGATYCRILPSLFLYSVDLGAHRGELADNLYGLSRMYGEQARVCQGRLQVSLLPMLIVLLGVFVGGVVLALFLPIIHMLRATQSG
ncbi:MAG: type II secretion system F family protein [Phycisphaerae bacterium]